MEPSPVRSRSDLHSSWLGLMEQDGKHQGWSGTESHLRGACIQAVMWSQTKNRGSPRCTTCLGRCPSPWSCSLLVHLGRWMELHVCVRSPQYWQGITPKNVEMFLTKPRVKEGWRKGSLSTQHGQHWIAIDPSGGSTQLSPHTFTHPKETPALLCPCHTRHWDPPKQPPYSPSPLPLLPTSPTPQGSQEEPQEMSPFYPNFDSDILLILKAEGKLLLSSSPTKLPCQGMCVLQLSAQVAVQEISSAGPQ